MYEARETQQHHLMVTSPVQLESSDFPPESRSIVTVSIKSELQCRQNDLQTWAVTKHFFYFFSFFTASRRLELFLLMS